MRVLELTIDAELAAGRHGEVIGRLEALLAEHPLNEGFYAQLMLALHRARRQLRCARGLPPGHRTLSEEIGIEPGPELRRLQEQILAQDPALDSAGAAAELPRELEGGSPLLAGRERELAWLRERWAESESGRARIALISGPAGIGKTRLAAELAAGLHRAGASVLYAAGSGPPEAVLDAIRPAGEGESPTLLVLDDADEAPSAVLEAAGALAAKRREAPLLILVLSGTSAGHRPWRSRAAASPHRLALDRLGADAVAEIAALYAPADGVAIPVEEADGRERRGAASRSPGGERLGSSARNRAAGGEGRHYGGRASDLRAAQAELAGSVADLQAARERTHLYLVSEPADPSAPEVCPFRGLAPFRPHRPSTSSAASASSPALSRGLSARPCWPCSGRRAVASPRCCAPGCCRRWRTACCQARGAGDRC